MAGSGCNSESKIVREIESERLTRYSISARLVRNLAFEIGKLTKRGEKERGTKRKRASITIRLKARAPPFSLVLLAAISGCQLHLVLRPGASWLDGGIECTQISRWK